MTTKSSSLVSDSASAIVLHRFGLSGHAHRVQLFLSLLGLPHRIVEVNLLAGEHKKPEFLKKNPLGKVPVIEDGELTLWDSNAILMYLAQRYDRSRTYWPEEPVAAARVQSFLSLAAGPLAYGPAALRVHALFKSRLDVEAAMTTTTNLFGYFENILSQQRFLSAPHPTLADVACYTYTAHAPEGGFSLEPYPAVRAWLTSVEALPGFVPMQRTPS
ncbi:MAG TPA: glutathione S-transferase [Polyangiaceae bacterium]|nr:glutathione S-transferase [Polyangiaceae bacterium]